jgi:hypothetical protein
MDTLRQIPPDPSSPKRGKASLTQGRSGGIYEKRSKDEERTGMKAKGTEKFTADSCKVRRLRRVLGM